MFIRIGKRYIPVAHIVRIEVDDTWVDIITARMTSEGVGQGDDWTATNEVIAYRTGTPEATALLAWADRQSEALA